MAKHRLQREPKVGKAARNAVIVGAVTAGGLSLPIGQASAAQLALPGLPGIEIPDFVPPNIAEQLQSMAPALPDVAPSPVGYRALSAGRTQVGASYVWGGSAPGGFDCSGFVSWAYRQAGVELPHSSFALADVGRPVAFHELQPGDIVVTNGGGHVAMYAGNGEIIHATTEGVPLGYSPLNEWSVYAMRRI